MQARRGTRPGQKADLDARDILGTREKEVLVQNRIVGEKRARVAACLVLIVGWVQVSEGLDCVIRHRGHTYAG